MTIAHDDPEDERRASDRTCAIFFLTLAVFAAAGLVIAARAAAAVEGRRSARNYAGADLHSCAERR